MRSGLLAGFPTRVRRRATGVTTLGSSTRVTTTRPRSGRGFYNVIVGNVACSRGGATNRQLVLTYVRLPGARRRIINDCHNFRLSLQFSAFRGRRRTLLGKALGCPIPLNSSPRKGVIHLSGTLDGFTSHDATTRGRLSALERRRTTTRIRITGPFPRRRRLTRGSTQLTRLGTRLSMSRGRRRPRRSRRRGRSTPHHSILTMLRRGTRGTRPIGPFGSCLSGSNSTQ